MSNNTTKLHNNTQKRINNEKPITLQKTTKEIKLNTIIDDSNEIYGNYKYFINDYIESILDHVSNSSIKSNNGQANKDLSKNQIDKNKKIYLNTYVIPLVYLINSVMYQRYLNKIKVINENININNNINYYKNYFFDYNLPVIKNINIKIYQNYFGVPKNVSSKKGKKNNKLNDVQQSQEMEDDTDFKIDKSKIKLLTSNLNNIGTIIHKLKKPFEILNIGENLQKNYKYNTVEKKREKITFLETIDSALQGNNKNKYEKNLKELYKTYINPDFNIQNAGGKKKSSLKKEFKENKLIKDFHKIFEVKHILSYDEIQDFLKDKYNNVHKKQKEEKDKKEKENKEQKERQSKLNQEEKKREEKRQKIKELFTEKKVSVPNSTGKLNHNSSYAKIEINSDIFDANKWTIKNDKAVRKAYTNQEKIKLNKQIHNNQINQNEIEKEIQKLKELEENEEIQRGIEENEKKIAKILQKNIKKQKELHEQISKSNELTKEIIQKAISGDEAYLKTGTAKLGSNLFHYDNLSDISQWYYDNNNNIVRNPYTKNEINNLNKKKKEWLEKIASKVATKGGNPNNLQTIENFYHEHLVKIFNETKKQITNVFSGNDGNNQSSEEIKNVNKYIIELKKQKIDFENEFKNISKFFDHSKDMFNLKKIYKDYTDLYKEQIKIIDDDIQELMIDQKKLNDQLQKKEKLESNKVRAEFELDAFKNGTFKNKKNNLGNVLKNNGTVDQNKVKSMKKTIRNNHGQQARYNLQNLDSKIASFKKSKSELDSKKTTIDTLTESIKQLESKESELRNINRELKELQQNKKIYEGIIEEINSKLQKIDKEFDFKTLKPAFVDYYNSNLDLLRNISNIIDENEKKKKQDLFKIFYDKDNELSKIISLIKGKFQNNNQKHSNNQSRKNNSNSSNQNNNQTNKNVNYKLIKKIIENCEKLSDVMDIYIIKSSNKNLNMNNSELRKNILSKINKVNKVNNQDNNQENNEIERVSVSTSTENLAQRAGQIINVNNNKKNRDINIIDDITSYLRGLKSKNINANNTLFFSKITNEINNFNLDEETKNYFNIIKETHDNLVDKLLKDIDNIENEKKDYLENKSLKDKFNNEFKYYTNEIAKLKNKYQRLTNPRYQKSEKIYVFTYTDSIKLYFIILHLMELFIYNY